MTSALLRQLAGGIGIFMIGMFTFEETLNQLASESFKDLLKKYTSNVWIAMIIGALTTALLHNSALISLIAIGFVSAGILSLRQAIAIIFGANIGTTFSGWTVALLGFKMDIDLFVLPMLALAGILLIFFSERRKITLRARTLSGFGFLFLGFGMIKDSVGAIAPYIDLQQYAGRGVWGFFLLGTVVTVAIQSSTMMRALTMTALFSGIVTFPQAVAIVIGSNLGTTSTAVLASLGGKPLKRQVAMSHVLFNFISCLGGMLLIYPSIWLIEDVLGFKNDPTFGLAIFDTAFNIVWVLAFVPFIGPFSTWVQKLFPDTLSKTELQIDQLDAHAIPEAIVSAFKHDTHYFIYKCIKCNLHILRLNPKKVTDASLDLSRIVEEQLDYDEGVMNEKYLQLTRLHNHLLSITLDEKWANSEKVRHHLQPYFDALTHALQSVKTLKDVAHHINEFAESPHRVLHHLYESLRTKYSQLYESIASVIDLNEHNDHPERLDELLEALHHDDTQFLHAISDDIKKHDIKSDHIAALLYVNRYAYFSAKAMVDAVR